MRKFTGGKIFWGLCVAMLLTALAHADVSFSFLGFNYESHSTSSPSLELTITNESPVLSGTWSAQLMSGSSSEHVETWFTVMIRRSDSQSQTGVSFSSREFPFLVADKKKWSCPFTFSSDAGTVVFDGQRSKQTARGSFSFTPNSNYVAQAGALLTSKPSPIELLELAFHKVTISEIEAFKSAGLKLNAQDVIKLKAFGVTADYAKAVCQPHHFSVEEIVKLHNFGVSKDDPAKIFAAGYHFDAEDLVKLHNFGVGVDEAAAWKTAGFNHGADDLVRLRNFGVRASFGKAVRSMFPNASSEEIVSLHNFGVNERYLEELQPNKAHFTAADVVKLHNFGVSAEYIRAWQQASFQFNAEDLIKLHNFGVPPEYAAALNVPNRKPLSAETIVGLRNRGLTAEEIRELRE